MTLMLPGKVAEIRELFPAPVKIRLCFSPGPGNLIPDDDVPNIPLFMADETDRLAVPGPEKKRWSDFLLFGIP